MQRQVTSWIRIVPIVAFFVVAQTFAQNTPDPKGMFSSKGNKFEIAGGVAFHGKSALDPEMPVIVVAITNTKLFADAVGDFVDRKRAIEQLVKDDKTPVVYLEFTPQGRWRGLSYYLGPGNGCGYCTSEVASTVKLANNRLVGSLKGAEQDRPFAVTLDLPILSEDHGAALPPDGGAPGKAYLAYHAALVTKNAAALEPTLSPDNLEVYERAAKNNNLPGYLAYMAEDHPVKSVKIIKAWARADKASLLIEGESGIGRVSGEVLLVNTNGRWGVDQELVSLVIGQ